MNNDTYTTRTEAIRIEILEPIQAGLDAGEDAAELFDIDAIADAVLGDYADGYTCEVEPAEFWTIVESHRAA